jgi:hypothetical protein
MSGQEMQRMMFYAMEQIDMVSKRLVSRGELTADQARIYRHGLHKIWEATNRLATAEQEALEKGDPFEEEPKERTLWEVWGMTGEAGCPFAWKIYRSTETEISRICLDLLHLRSNDRDFVVWAVPVIEGNTTAQTHIQLTPCDFRDANQLFLQQQAAVTV